MVVEKGIDRLQLKMLEWVTWKRIQTAFSNAVMSVYGGAEAGIIIDSEWQKRMRIK